MTTKYAQLFQRFHIRGLLVLAVILASAIAFATPAQATEASHAATGGASDAAVATCTIATPGLNLSPSSQDAEAGPNLVYTVSLTNNDNPGCSASSFDLTVTYLPGGWIGELSTNRLNLSPGATGTAILSVTPENDTPTSSVNLQVAVSDAHEPTHAKAAMATYPADDTAMGIHDVVSSTVPAEPVAGETSTPVNLSSDPGTDNVGVAGDRIARVGATVAASSGGLAARSSAETAERLTLRLTGLLNAYNHANGSAKADALEELVASAEERHALLASLITDDPGAVLRVAVPARVRDSMPAEVRALVEQRLDLEGELEVLYEDYPDGTHRLRHFLNADGEQFSLHFADGPPLLLTGTEVRAHGVALSVGGREGVPDGAMALRSGDEEPEVLACCDGSGGTTGTTSPSPVPDTFGEQRTLVLLVNFQNLQGEPWTVEEVHSLFFRTTSDFLLENSYGQTWLNGDVYGWYTIPMDALCDRTNIARLAEEAATNNGVDLSSYSRLVYMWPDMGCSWGGLSTVGGNPSRAYFNGALYLKIVGHELGHNLGLYHAHGLNCSDGVLGLDCIMHDYGDAMDIMGSRPAHFNAFQKERLGWLGYGASPGIATVTAEGTYQIAPYESIDSAVKALKIPRGTDPVSGETTWFYVEYRQPIGFDGWINDGYFDRDNVFGGVLIHHETEGNPTTSLLLDMTPNSYDGVDLMDLIHDPALVAGLTYEDPESGIILSPAWTDEGGAMVNVGFAQPSCVPSNPRVTISPSESQWIPPGTAFDYEVMVTNGDSNTCADATFDVSDQVPEGWTALLDGAVMTLAPGASGLRRLTVTSPLTATDGFYDVFVETVNQADPRYVASENATYVVSTGATSKGQGNGAGSNLGKGKKK